MFLKLHPRLAPYKAMGIAVHELSLKADGGSAAQALLMPLLADRASQAIDIARRGDEPLAVLFLDLDHFKNVNDSLGHRVGDSLLTQLAARLRGAVREQDTVARMGGDEFVLVRKMDRVDWLDDEPVSSTAAHA